MDVIKQHLGVWALQIQYYSKIFVLGAFFTNVFTPKGWQKNSPNYKNPRMFGYYQWCNGFMHFHMKFRCKKHNRCIYTRPRPVLKRPGDGKQGLGFLYSLYFISRNCLLKNKIIRIFMILYNLRIFAVLFVCVFHRVVGGGAAGGPPPRIQRNTQTKSGGNTQVI